MNEIMTGRSLKNLSPEEIIDLLTTAGIKINALITVDSDGWHGDSRHPIYGVKYSLEKVGMDAAREKLTAATWKMCGGESEDHDPEPIEIYSGYIIGEWGGCYAPVQVVKWFIYHGFYFAAEGKAAGMIAAERIRHASKGFTAEHDDEHRDGSLMQAAGCYMGTGYAMLVKSGKPIPPCFVPKDWPWNAEDWTTPENPIRAYVIAASLVAAELDRILRIIDGKAVIEPKPSMEQHVLSVKRAFPQSYSVKGPSESWYVWSTNSDPTCLGTGQTEIDAWAEAAMYVSRRA